MPISLRRFCLIAPITLLVLCGTATGFAEEANPVHYVGYIKHFTPKASYKSIDTRQAGYAKISVNYRHATSMRIRFGRTSDFQYTTAVKTLPQPPRILPVEQGNLTTTGNDTDLAISGKGFFVVGRTSMALTTPSLRSYTRFGRFYINGYGDLVTAGGQRVFGWADNAGAPDKTTPILLTINPVTTASYSIGQNGAVTTIDNAGNPPSIIGWIRMAKFEDPHRLIKNGYSFRPTSRSGDITEGTAGDNNGLGLLSAGALELSGGECRPEQSDEAVTTGCPLDTRIDGNGTFLTAAAISAEGAPSGLIHATRLGDFRYDYNGYLVTGDDRYVLGTPRANCNGLAEPADTLGELRALKILENSLYSRINEDGTITHVDNLGNPPCTGDTIAHAEFSDDVYMDEVGSEDYIVPSDISAADITVGTAESDQFGITVTGELESDAIYDKVATRAMKLPQGYWYVQVILKNPSGTARTTVRRIYVK